MLVSVKVDGLTSPRRPSSRRCSHCPTSYWRCRSRRSPRRSRWSGRRTNRPGLPPEQAAKTPEAPVAGAAKVTFTLGTGLPNWSTSSTSRAVPNGRVDRGALVVALDDGHGVTGGLRGDRHRGRAPGGRTVLGRDGRGGRCLVAVVLGRRAHAVGEGHRGAAPRVPPAESGGEEPLGRAGAERQRRGARARRGVAVLVLELEAERDVGRAPRRLAVPGVGVMSDLGGRPGGVGLGEVDACRCRWPSAEMV